MSKRQQYRIPKDIIVLKNKDKKQNERWTQDRKKNPANWPCPSRFIFVSRPGRGKTLVMKNILLQSRPLIECLILVHPDGSISREWEDLDPTYILEEPPDSAFFEQLVREDGTFPRTFVCIDDIELYKTRKDILANIATLMRYYSTHRFITTMLSFQSFFDIPPIFRKLANVFVLWKPLVSNEMTTIENRIGMKKDQLAQLFEQFCPSQHDFIVVDHTEDSPMPLRCGLFKKIEIEQDSSDESDSPVAELEQEDDI